MSTEPMTTGWYYQKASAGGQQPLGPVTWEELVSYARSGALAQNDVVWHKQLGNWMPATQIQGLFPMPAAPAAPAPAPGTIAPGYAAPQGYGAPAPAKRRVSPLAWAIPLAAVVLAGIFLGLYFGVWRDGDKTTTSTERTTTTESVTTTEAATTTSSEAPYVQAEGEIFLEPSGEAGPESFAGEQFVLAGPTTTLSIPTTLFTTTTLPATTTTAAGGVQPVAVTTLRGDTPALYGGSKSKQIADKEGQLAFLAANPDKAAAFCAALNADPNLRWSGGTQVTPEQLPAYFAELTPMQLTRDTRVTNHGYRDGKPTPRQSVLQAGQLVLVDQYGVPRVRCECGNPLTPPKPVRGTPTYTGPRWPGFDPTTVIVIQQTTVIINIFVVVDINTGEPFSRPAGTDGSRDAAAPTTTTSSTATGAPVSGAELEGLWTGSFTVTDINIPEEMEGAAADEGCDLAVLEAMLGQALPMTLEMTVDPGNQSGSAVMLIDVSSLDTGESGEFSSEPLMLTWTLQGGTITFDAGDAEVTTDMTGTVTRQGQTLVMTGTMFSGESGIGMYADWEATRQVGR
ncbi:MAG: DUF4339 domain-containing protein [Thermoleophilia bacterium]|nr:DUF4339 domain-containing protein [Thermoleophilia bacterium]